MATYKVISKNGNTIEVSDINSLQPNPIILTMVNNSGCQTVTLYDQTSAIWDFAGGPYKPSDYEVGKQFKLIQKIP